MCFNKMFLADLPAQHFAKQRIPASFKQLFSLYLALFHLLSQGLNSFCYESKEII